MPNDVIEGRMMAEVHYYTPPQFTGVWENNAPIYFWGNGNHISSGSWKNYNATWGEEDYLKSQLQSMYDHFTSKGYPVILGEYGANWRNLGNSAAQKKHDASILLFNKLVCQYSVDYGIVPYVWDINVAAQNGTSGIMTVINRNNCSIFCSPAHQGIMEGCEAGKWPFSTALQGVQEDSSTTPAPQYNLLGQTVKDAYSGLLLTRRHKLFYR